MHIGRDEEMILLVAQDQDLPDRELVREGSGREVGCGGRSWGSWSSR